MAASMQSVVVTKPDADTIQIAIGNETYRVPISQIVGLWDGNRDINCLLWQMFAVLRTANVNPKTATALQMKNAIEAQQYLWGN